MSRIVDKSTGEILDNISSTSTLGTIAKSVDKKHLRHGKRADAYRLQRLSSKNLPGHRVCKCQVTPTEGTSVKLIVNQDGVASYRGLQTCGSVWVCPVCSAKVTHARKDELNTLLQWSRKMGYAPLLLTLTIRHKDNESLSETLQRLKAAKRTFHQSRQWRQLGDHLVGHVTATEVTHGANGWHPHLHMILIFDHPNPGRLLAALRAVWLHAIESVGGSGNDRAYHVQDADQTGAYVAKWGAASEMTLSGGKSAKGLSRSVWQILADSEDDPQSALLWAEYAKEFHGKRQLTWSRGLKALLGIIERSDEDIAGEEQNAEPDETDEVVCIFTREEWYTVVAGGHRAELLQVAEQGGFSYVEMWLHALMRGKGS